MGVERNTTYKFGGEIFYFYFPIYRFILRLATCIEFGRIRLMHGLMGRRPAGPLTSYNQSQLKAFLSMRLRYLANKNLVHERMHS